MMYISYETRLKIESIAWKIANMDVDPVLFIESYMQFKSPVVLNEQGITNWWQNIKNYMKGGAAGYYGGQVDIKAKYEEAKNAINAIVKLLKSPDFKGNLDQAVEDQVVDHLEDVVNQMVKADRHVDHLSTRLQQSNREKKMYGRDVTHAQSLPDNYFDNITIVGNLSEDVNRIIAAVGASSPEVKKIINENAMMSERRIGQKIFKQLDTLPGTQFQSLVSGGAAANEQEAKTIVGFIISFLMNRRILPIANSSAASAPANESSQDVYATKLGDALKNGTYDKRQAGLILQRPEVTGNLLDTKANSLKGSPVFANAYLNAKDPAKGMPTLTDDQFAKMAVYLNGIKYLQQSLS